MRDAEKSAKKKRGKRDPTERVFPGQRNKGCRENDVKAKLRTGLLPSGNSCRPREKSSHVRGLPRRDTGTHLNLCFLPPIILKAPMLRACLRLSTNHLSFPPSLDMNVRNTNRRIRMWIGGFLNRDCIRCFSTTSWDDFTTH